MLPAKLTTRNTGLHRKDLNTLLKKQEWLRKYRVSLPAGAKSLQSAVDATLVFAQEEAGTAVCIAQRGLLLTCSHCVAETEGDLNTDKVHCLLFSSGQVVQAKCMAWDGKRDLALLEIVAAQGSTTDSFPCIQVSSTLPKLKDRLICVGHPGSEDLENVVPGVKTNYETLYVSSGAFRGYAKGQDLHDNSDIGALKHDCWTYWGHSGAPLVAENGELVGLHSSWDDKSGMRRGIALEAIKVFLENDGAFDTKSAKVDVGKKEIVEIDLTQ